MSLQSACNPRLLLSEEYELLLLLLLLHFTSTIYQHVCWLGSYPGHIYLHLRFHIPFAVSHYLGGVWGLALFVISRYILSKEQFKGGTQILAPYSRGKGSHFITLIFDVARSKQRERGNRQGQQATRHM
jgi:hypothetical protein